MDSRAQPPMREEQSPFMCPLFLEVAQDTAALLVYSLNPEIFGKSNVEMKSKCGLGVILLAVVLSAFGAWFLPASSATTDILLLLSGGASIQPTTLTAPYENNTYSSYHLEREDLHTTLLEIPAAVTDQNETSQKSTLSDTKVQPDYAPSVDSFATQKPSTWTADDLTAALNFSVEVNTDKEEVTGTISNFYTNSSQSIKPKDLSLAPDMITSGMDVNMTSCIVSGGPKGGEILAIALGVAFLTILFGALFYQLVLYLRERKIKRLSSVYIIENEMNKYNLEANITEPETKL
ncbi:uncharacterized protein O3C94_003681 [Discoglossus pictus]